MIAVRYGTLGVAEIEAILCVVAVVYIFIMNLV
jgi:hypothetical protein